VAEKGAISVGTLLLDKDTNPIGALLLNPTKQTTIVHELCS
jgi:hypothetical protein